MTALTARVDIAWQAGWISPTDAEPGSAGFRPAYRLRGELDVEGEVARATLHATAHGIYRAEIDGRRVGDEELAPGYTEYQHRTQVQSYDVTELLTPGRHTLDALLADGWYRGQVGMLNASDQWGTRTAFLAQLEIEYADGSRTVAGTGPDWCWTRSHITAADLIEGQREDRRLLRQDAAWHPVEVSDRGYAALVAPVAPPVRRVEELRPVSVTELRPGVHVVDLGQNVNGWVRLTNLGPDGTETTLTHGEALGPGGDVTMEHLRPNAPFLPEPLSAGQVDVVVSAGLEGDVFEPCFTTHGFRYVRVEGHPGPLTADDVTGVVVHTDLERRGWFACSDERLERLHDAAVWSFRGNACDIPTDCPTRERAGWTGDWQLYVPTATYLFDVLGFSRKWLLDLVVEQWDDGNLGNMAPMPPAERTGFLEKMNGSAGWGDAIVLVPWELHQEYGDTAVLAETWPALVRWLDRVERMASGQRHPDRVAKHPEPVPHEQHLWDTGFHWGEWLEPGGEPGDFPAFIAMDKSDVATAFYAWSTRHAAGIAALLGHEAEAARYAELSGRVADAWRTEFVTSEGHVEPQTQATLVRALAFDLVGEEHRQRVADDLAELVRGAGTHLGTGFLATPDLLPALADHGHLDLAYELLLQDTEPSWLTMIDRGATTVWERWDGVRADGSVHESLNHYSKGAVISFLHRHVAGLQRLEPTWTRFRVAPRPGGGLTSASTAHLTPHGRIEVAWRAGEVFELTVTVPPGCTGDVVLPDGTTRQVTEGTHRVVAVMRNVVVTDPPRADPEHAEALAAYGVATVHEALDRVGYLGPDLRPCWPGARVGGTAVTALCWPGDNLMIHVAVEQCRPGDVLVVATTSPCTDGLFGELFATALAHRGVRGAVLGCGVRDTAELSAMGFPVWSRAVSAQGSVKATAGAVNVPVVLGAQPVRPGDVVLGDDDGVLVVPRADVPRALDGARARAEKEGATRAAFAAGQLGLDRYGLRERLPGMGIEYVTHAEYAEGARDE